MSSAPEEIGAAPPRPFSPRFTTLSADEEVHLWCLSLPQLPLAPHLARLSNTERQRADRFARREDFECFVKSRGALRTVLAACSGQPMQALDLAADQDDKPRLHHAGGLEFSLSHSGGRVLIGVGCRPLGVDIESLGREIDWNRIAAHCFHPQERAVLSAWPPAERREAFFQTWTQKEAYLKGTGRGVAGNLADFATAPQGGPVDDCIAGAADGTRGAVWYTSPLAAPAGYKAALAAPFRIDRRNVVMRMGLPAIAA